MTELIVRGIKLDVDYAEELQEYMEQFGRYKIRDNKIQSCSPFRYEMHPSFAVNLDNGTWVDSGAETEEERKGNFTSLLSFLRQESYSETCEYLLDKYASIYDDVDNLKLSLNLSIDVEPRLIEDWEQYNYGECDYLTGRKISKEIQEYFGTGMSIRGDAVVLPWHDRTGKVINIKYRKIIDKTFFYSKGGKPVKQYLYGAFAVRNIGATIIAITESEIDALYLWTLGIPAVAVGGASLSEQQQQELLLLGIETLIIATDMDTVGERFAEVLALELGGYMDVKRMILPTGKKDVNECNASEIYESYQNMKQILQNCF